WIRDGLRPYTRGGTRAPRLRLHLAIHDRLPAPAARIRPLGHAAGPRPRADLARDLERPALACAGERRDCDLLSRPGVRRDRRSRRRRTRHVALALATTFHIGFLWVPASSQTASAVLHV